MAATTLTGVDELRSKLGEELGVSDWHQVTQDAIDQFADVTGDHQWIHVDRERAAASQFGGTIAHGYFTLSIGPLLSEQVYAFEGFAFGLNYGLNRLRFPSPLPVGQKVRMRATLTKVEDVAGGVQAELTHTFEREGGDKPVCVAEVLVRLYHEAA